MSTYFAADSGTLTASRAVIRALSTIATGAGAGTDEVDRAALDLELAAAGAGTLDDPHPRLAQALLAPGRPIAGLTIAKTGFAMPGWLGEGWFAMHVFRSGDEPAPHDQLVSMPADHLPVFLSWLLDLGPRERVDRPDAITVDPAALNRAIALNLGERPVAGVLPEPLDDLFTHRFRDHWIVSSTWPPAPGAPDAILLEVVDTDHGLWDVRRRREDGAAALHALTPVEAFAILCDLIPDSDLVDHTAPRLPLERTPVLGGGLTWVGDVLQAEGDPPPAPPA